MMAAETVLAPQTAAQLGHGGALEDFAQYVCTTLGMWGSYHLGCLPPDRKARFLQLVRWPPLDSASPLAETAVLII